VCFLEGEMLFNTKGEVPEEEYVIPARQGGPQARGRHATIVTWGKMALVAVQAADLLAKEGDPRRRRRPPRRCARWTPRRYASVRKTNRCVVV
jgi:pyruvate/2-oxoglutarate/acetoin dehydrogenase E1 component